MKELRKILWPFSLVYQAITSIRNFAFDQKWLASRGFEIPLISIGNLSTGGTGKTPMVEFLVKYLKDLEVGVVSRGYGRKTKGVVHASSKSTASQIGDEPLQILNKYPDIKLVVSEKRVLGVESLIKKHPETRVIVLDDAFQHRYIIPSFQILLTTYQNPYYKDLVLPAGDLRENSSGRKRASCIVVTKCPKQLGREEADGIESKLKAKNIPVFFTTLNYSKPQAIISKGLPNKEIVLVTGIANPVPLISHLEKSYLIVKHLKFTDHHNFSSSDIENIVSGLNKGTSLVTTEKDITRLKTMLSEDILKRTFTIPIEVQFLFDQKEDFLNLIDPLL